MTDASAQTLEGTRRGSLGRFARLAGGWALVAVGTLGCVVPVIPGIPLLLAGLALLSENYVWARWAQSRVKSWIAKVKERLTGR